MSPLITSKRNAERRKKAQQAKAKTYSYFLELKAAKPPPDKSFQEESPSGSSQPIASKGVKKKA